MPQKPLEIAGERYGRLMAIRFSKRAKGVSYWLFRCDCGVEKEISVNNVRHGKTVSCGCYRREIAPLVSRNSKGVPPRHGHTRGRKKSKTFLSYQSAKSRCTNPNDRYFQRYGERGITMCAEWLSSFDQFLADMGECPPKMTLDRIDNDGPYSAVNCRWATQKQQQRNRSNNIWVNFRGRRVLLLEVCEMTGVSRKRLDYRMKEKGLTLESALALG